MMAAYRVSGATVLVMTLAMAACNGGGGGGGGGSTTFTPLTNPMNVTTYHNDNMRTGQQVNETVLTRAAVSGGTFGKVASIPVDGVVYSQPLFLYGVTVPGQTGTHNLVYVTTEHDSVYAFDTGTLSLTPVWHRNFTGDSLYGCSNCRTRSYLDVNAPNVYPEIGITSTPVIDEINGILYVIATTNENGAVYQKIHGLEVGTGKEIAGSPIVVSAKIPGNGSGHASDGYIYFDAAAQLSRAALLLTSGHLIVAFSSYDDAEPSHGWVLSYNASNLAYQGAWMGTPHSGLGSVWGSGAGPAVDASGAVYFVTANNDPGIFYAGDYDDSLVRLSIGTSGTLNLADFFQPYNRVALNATDIDYGSGGVMLLPDQPGPYPHLAVSAGKQGTIYLNNRDHLGGQILSTNPSATSDSQIVQELQNELPGGGPDGAGVYSTPAYFNSNIYYRGAGDYLRKFPLSSGLIDTAHQEIAKEHSLLEGSTPSVSANGTANGIVWVLDGSAYQYNWNPPSLNLLHNGPAILYAYNSDDLSAPLWESDHIAADAAGDATKYAAPMIANGMVFVGTQTELSIYGMKTPGTATTGIGGGRVHILPIKGRGPSSADQWVTQRAQKAFDGYVLHRHNRRAKINSCKMPPASNWPF